MKDSFGRRWKPADGLAASSANRRESNGWNPLVRSRKFNIHRKMRIHSRPPDGRVVTRSGLPIDETGRRSLELYSPEGELLRAWSVGPGRLVSGWAAMDRGDPTRHVFRDAAGKTWLVRFPPLTGIN